MPDANQPLVDSVDRLRKSVDQLRDELVRKDVFDQVLQNINGRFKDLSEDIASINRRLDRQDDDSKANRRLLIASFVGPLVILLLGIYIATQVGGPPT